MSRLSLWTKVFLGLVAFSILGTILTTVAGKDPGLIRPIASAATLACGVVALARGLSIWRVGAVLLLGALVEIEGLYMGFPFGRYTYTDTWQPTVHLPGGHNFPLLLPFAWFLVAGGCALALRPLGFASLILAPVAATLIDIVMEPVMTGKLGYWRWLDPGILPGGAPWLNPIGWLLTSFLAALILWKGNVRSPEPVWVVAGYLVLIAGLWLA